jgi:hypothetical protein
MNTICKILDMQRLNPEGLVFRVTYEFKAFLGQNFETLKGSMDLESSSNSEDFIPFELLTELIVIDWVKNKLGEEEVSLIEEELKTKLRNKLKSRFETESRGRRISNGLPWVR